ncbi:MAG: LamG domain-containing protein, partial [Phycisphaerae bacterium]|nr:LamG domain-containing protein [Phycisphaerae bacterium]
MLKNLMVLFSLAVVSLAFAETEKDGPSLDLKFEGPMTIKAGGGEVKIAGPIVKAPDGKSGLAVGSTQDLPRIPAAEFVGETGTIMLTFMSQPVKPENSLLNRSILVLRGDGRERVTFGLPGGVSKSLQFTFRKFTDPKTFETTTPIEFGRWYQAVCTWDGLTVKLFLDGVLQTEFQQPYVPKFPAVSTFFYTGPYVDGYTNPNPWNEDSCLIHQIKVY